MLYVPVENALIQNTKIDETIQSTIYSKVDISITNKENSENSDSKLPKVFIKILLPKKKYHNPNVEKN